MTKATTIRMTDRVKEQIDDLIAAGFGTHRTDIINLAVDRMHQQEIVQRPEKKKKPWSVVHED